VSFTFDESVEELVSVVAATTETTSEVEAIETGALGDMLAVVVDIELSGTAATSTEEEETMGIVAIVSITAIAFAIVSTLLSGTKSEMNSSIVSGSPNGG
jgi:hypothetical protein